MTSDFCRCYVYYVAGEYKATLDHTTCQYDTAPRECLLTIANDPRTPLDGAFFPQFRVWFGGTELRKKISFFRFSELVCSARRRDDVEATTSSALCTRPETPLAAAITHPRVAGQRPSHH